MGAAELAQQLAGLLDDLRPQSLIALAHAMAVAEIDGVAGTLVIKLPTQRDRDVDVSFTTGRIKLTMEP